MTDHTADPTSDDVDEQEAELDAPLAAKIPRTKVARVWWVTGILFVITLVGTVVVLLLPSGYVTEAPGSTFDTADRVSVPADVKTFDHEGGYRFVTASETTRPIFWQAFTGWLGPNTDVFPKELILGKVTSAEERRFSAVLMSNSKLSAVYQALSQLGYPVSKMGGGVFVSQVIDDSPADGVLTNGDTITKIDSTPITSTADLQRYMAEEAEIGQEMTLTIDRLGVSDSKEVDLTVGSTERDGKKQPYLGIYMETRPHFRLPFSVDFDTGNVGGPSAGLALTLSLVDELSPKGLTNGNEVVATGTMNVDGTIGAIGGVRQKVAAVKRDGIRYFMVPTANYEEASKAAGSSVDVIPVKTLEDAIARSRALPAPTSD